MVATTADLTRALDDLVERLATSIRLEAIILYGSYVKGHPDDWSDIDVAVISPDFENMSMFKRQQLLAHLTFRADARLSLIGYPSSEYHNPGPHSFLGEEIMRTGRVVYQAEPAEA